MKKRILILLISGFIITGFTSMNGRLINFDATTIEDMILQEKKQGGIAIDTIKNFGILKNPHNDIYTLIQTEAYIYKRIYDDFDPQLHVWYHFDKETKKIKGIRCNWGLYNPSFNPRKEKDRLIELSKKEKIFKRKYKSLKKELIGSYGKPIKSKTIKDDKYGLIENIFWEDEEKIIGLSIKFERKLKEIPGVGVLGDYKIEIMMTNKL